MTDPKYDVSKRVLAHWCQGLTTVMAEEVGGLMELMSDLWKLYNPDQGTEALTHKTSILGEIGLRNILCGTKLNT